MTTTTSKRDELRAKTLSDAPKFRHKIVEYKGERYEIRQPTVRARMEIVKRGVSGTGIVDGLVVMVWAVIYNTYVPGTDERVYDESDYDVLVARPAGGFIDSFGEVAADLMGTSTTDIKKNNLSKV